jgi:tetratricopeptide (TPR) repeat protein
LPFPRPRSFVGRQVQLRHIQAHIQGEQGARTAIYGLGGSGKTSLALESAYWTKEQRPTCAIFWVPAISRESFEKAYHDIAKCLCLPGIDNAEVDIKRLVWAKLSDNDFGPWLIIVDNADDTSILFSGSESDRLIDCLPRSHRGSIIFTTRTRVAAIELAENNVLALGELQRAEAIEMLDKRLLHTHRHQLKESDTVNTLLEMLHHHALAIVQAVAFINTNDVTLSDYINLYRSSEADAMDLLSENFSEQTRYQEATNAVATTWYISFEQIQRQNATASDRLRFMACTAHNDIPASIYPLDCTKTEHLKAMGTLKAYDFISERHPQADIPQEQPQILHKKYDVHPLVHLAIRGWLKSHHQWIPWLERALARVTDIVPYGDHDTRDHWTAYMHHAMHLIGLPEVHAMQDRMTLLERIGRCERSLGKFHVAERVYRQSLEQRLIMSGEEHPQTLMTMGNIGLMLGFQSKWVEAEKIHREELRLVKKTLGEKHPQTLVSTGNLALAMLGQWRYAEAETIYRALLPLDKEVLGEKHPDTIVSMQNLGGALRGLGNLDEAEHLHRASLALTREVRGPQHSDTLSALSALGTVLRTQHKYTEAEAIHREEIQLRQKVLGPDHPDTVRSMSKLGEVLSVQEKYTEAQEIQAAALAICEKQDWADRPVTLGVKSDIAHTLLSQGMYAEAEQLHRETLATKEKVLGSEHRDTFLSVFWLAQLLFDQLRYEDALPLYERACVGLERTVGRENASAKECGEQLAWVRGVVEERRAREEERMAMEEEDRVAETGKVGKEEEGATESVQANSRFTLVDTMTESMGEGDGKRRGKWRARLGKMVKKAG